MSKNSAYGLPPYIPKHFEYKGLALELVDVNGVAEGVVFRAYPTKEGKNLLDYVDSLPNDYYFHYLFTCIFGLTVEDVAVRLEIDDANEATAMYVNMQCVPSPSILDTLRKQVPVFIHTFGRNTNELYSNTRPFCLNNLRDTVNDEKSTTSIHGVIHCSVQMVNGLSKMERYMTSYGVSIDLNISNYPEIVKKFPNYSILLHDELYSDYIDPIVRECEKQIHKMLDPLGVMKIGFKRKYIDASRTEVVSTISLKVMIWPQYINGVELYELTPTAMTFRPVRPGVTFDKFSQIDWTDAKTYVSQIATALLSDNGTLFIPEITSVDTTYVDGKQWIKVFFCPHFAHFTKDQIFYGRPDIVERYGNEFHWFNGELGSFMQFLFPSVANLPDPTVICYGRVMKDFFMARMDTIAAMLTCEQIHIRIAAELDNWVYFALVDCTMMHTLTTFLNFDEFYLADITTDLTDNLKAALHTIVGAFCASDPDSIISALEPEQYKKLVDDCNGDEVLAIINCWEASAHMMNRGFAAEYKEVRDEILDTVRKGNDQAIRESSVRSEIRCSMSPTMKATTTINFLDMAKMAQNHREKKEEQEKPTRDGTGFIGRLFGKR